MGYAVMSGMQVPPEAALQKRGHGVRVLILSRNIVRPNDFLGQADVPLSLLQVRVRDNTLVRVHTYG